MTTILTPINQQIRSAWPTLDPSTRGCRLVNIHPSPFVPIFTFSTPIPGHRAGVPVVGPPFGAGDWTLQRSILHQAAHRVAFICTRHSYEVPLHHL